MNAISSVARRSLHFYAFGLIAALFLISRLSAADVVMTQTLPAYGGGLDVDGDVALVGDPGNDDQGEDVGAVHVLSRIAGRWTETDIFYPADPSTATGFGQDIALDGARALIVASGEAFIVELQDGIWVQQDQLLPDCAPACDTYFRRGSLALSQDHAALGAWRAGSSGLVYVFKKRRAGWRQEALLEPTDKRVSEFGASVALDGQTLIVGAPETSTYKVPVSGAAYVYRRRGTTWTERAQLGGCHYYAHCGMEVAVHEGTAAVSSFYQAEYGDTTGSVYLYSGFASNWVSEGRVKGDWARPGNYFGNSLQQPGDAIALGDGILVAGDPLVYGRGSEFASAYLFRRIDGAWVRMQKFAPDGVATPEDFGSQLVLSGTTLMAGVSDRLYVYEIGREIAIDVIPGNPHNALNLQTQERFWVAAVSDTDFDALQIDPDSVRLGPNDAASDAHRVRNVNADGLPDLELRFQTEAVDLSCGQGTLTLTGLTYSGGSVRGEDLIEVRGCIDAEIRITVKAPPFSSDRGLVSLSDRSLYVVLMSQEGFDPGTVDTASIRLADTGAAPRGINLVDRNGDGVLDLRLRYRLSDVSLSCGDLNIWVSGMTSAGTTFSGLLALSVSGCP